MSVSLKEKRAGKLLLGALCVIYFVSYVSRLDYATVLAEIVVSENILKSEAALATTACFITYGIGQLISGWLGDRINPKWLIFFGLCLTCGMNFLMPRCHSVGNMVAVWGVNGFAQAMMWPPVVRFLSDYMDHERFQKACVSVSMASSSATVLLYLVAPVVIRLGSWRSIFYIACGMAGVTAALWLAFINPFEKKYADLRRIPAPVGRTPPSVKTESKPEKSVLSRLIFGEGLIFVMVAIVMQGTLRDGVTTWLPSYLVEVFRLDTGSSILSCVIIPLFSMVIFKVCTFLNQKYFRDEVRFSNLLFVLASLLALALAAVFTASAVVATVLAALLTACMHGINLMLVCDLPGRFAATGKVSLISGVLNACTYVGSALSTYCFALIAQTAGWRVTVLCWAAVCVVGVLSCFAVRRLKKAGKTGW